MADQSASALEFIAHFGDVFTTNYDLLLYWVRLDRESKYSDGFGTAQKIDGSRIWFPHGDQNVHHLHGSLCLYQNELETIKFVRKNGILMKQIKDHVKGGGLPLIVFEGSSEAKRQRIEANQYLRTCHRRLREAGGCLFTYGFAFSENDRHIVEHIIGGFEHLYIGLYNSTEKASIVATIEKARESLNIDQGNMPNVEYYDSSENNLWSGSPEEI